MTAIVNCHVHTFTTRHAPRYFPAAPAMALRHAPGLLRFARRLSWFLPGRDAHAFMTRLETFHATGSRQTQADVFRELLHYYPRGTRFCVLPLDMGPMGYGPVDEDIRAQHDELAALARDPLYGPQVIPFACVHPGTPGAAAEFRRCADDLGFRGLKLYPRTGFAPDDPVLMEEVYPLCVERGLPVISHCARGGVARKGWDASRANAVTAPEAYEPVLRAFPGLRVCLAHYGGAPDWTRYLRDGFDPADRQARSRNWVWRINDMIASGRWPGLWTDISYTIFKFDEYAPLLRLFLKDEDVRRRVLFGSDFYMTRQERLSEKAISIRLRDTLGEENFHQIADVNPRIWLGEADGLDAPAPAA